MAQVTEKPAAIEEPTDVLPATASNNSSKATSRADRPQEVLKATNGAAADAPAAPQEHRHQQGPKGRKLLVILHGKRLDDDTVRNAILLVVRVTWDSGDVEQFVKEAFELWDTHRYDTLVAGGGDGTLNELVVALLQHKAPHHITVAQLPLGTANDLASAAGISLVSERGCVTQQLFPRLLPAMALLAHQ